MGAHSHEAGRRWWNLHTPERYIAAVTGGASPVAVSEILSDDERRAEALQLAVRTREGVPAAALPADGAIRDLVEVHDATAVLTVDGRLLASEVAVRLQ